MNEFLGQCDDSEFKQHAPSGATWASLPLVLRISRHVWGLFATFLCSIYKMPVGKRNAGKHLESKNVLQCWSGMINQAFTQCSAAGMDEDAKVPRDSARAHSFPARTPSACRISRSSRAPRTRPNSV